MRKIISTIFLLFCLGLMSNCSKDDEQTEITPTNLVINTQISSDGSGNVNFTAIAVNAVSYDYEFGNGEVETVSSGILSYTYTLEGTNSYPVTVTARSNSGLATKKTVEITVTVENSFSDGVFWSEEFNVDGAPDPSKWGYDLGAGGWGNSELQCYTSRSDNVIVQDGVLKISAIKENYNGSEYTSTRLLSMNKFTFKYGKIEVRAKLPLGVGTWSAIWMLGSDIGTVGWPACGEIDIMEHLGRDINRIYGTLHYPGHSGGSANGSTNVITNATTQFHIYTVDWTAAYIKIYVDDVLFHTVVNSSNIPFNHDFFIILNVAMGGNFGGGVDPAFTNATMEVDYIRIYK